MTIYSRSLGNRTTSARSAHPVTPSFDVGGVVREGQLRKALEVLQHKIWRCLSTDQFLPSLLQGLLAKLDAFEQAG